jgi:hypothetical protein
LHTNFKLKADGDYLALFSPDSTVSATTLLNKFPTQFADISYGRAGAGVNGAWGYMKQMSPGQ